MQIVTTFGFTIEFDPDKSDRNVAAGRPSFRMAVHFDWASAVIVPDDRRDYGEARFVACGLLKSRLHTLVFTPRGDAVRIVSFRRAHQEEFDRLAEEADRRSGS